MTYTMKRRVSTKEMAVTHGAEVIRLREELGYSWGKVCDATGLKIPAVHAVYLHALDMRSKEAPTTGELIHSRHQKVRDFIQLDEHPGYIVLGIKEHVETHYKKNFKGEYVLAGMEQTFRVESYNAEEGKMLHCTVTQFDDHTLRESGDCDVSIIMVQSWQ